VIDVADLPNKYRHTETDDYRPDYPEELLEREAINELFRSASEQDSTNDEQQIAEHSSGKSLPPEGMNLKEYLSELEISLISQALTQQDWVVARSAETLGMRRTTLVEKMRKYNISKD
jgi:sigma-54 specific flagellar transcriptional regulator A